MTIAYKPRILFTALLVFVISIFLTGALGVFTPVRAATTVTPSAASSPQQQENATPTPTVEPTSSPTLPAPTPSLTASLTPTERPTLIPTEEPTPTPLPKSADTTGVLGLGIAIVLIVLVGSFLGVLRPKMK